MNRIRKHKVNDKVKYQVIMTPNQKYNVGFEFLLGSWTDAGLTGFKVDEFDTYHDAECVASNYPDIEWEKLHDFHKDNYFKLNGIIKEVLGEIDMAIEFKSRILSPKEIKNVMFDRILEAQSNGNIFRIPYKMNDIISFRIINPWFDNLAELEKHLVNEDNLRLYRRMEKGKVITLIGRTDFGTTYEIQLCPSLIDNWIEWKTKRENNDVGKSGINLSYKKVIELQNVIDSSFRLR